jgi:RNA polymerase sigma-70 factor (ECF subfamily)
MEPAGALWALDERELVECARTDAEAFAVLYRRYVDRIHGFAYRRSGSRDVAEDVTAATFERALRYLHGFDWRSGGFAPWLYRIAANELATHYRREYRPRSDKAQAVFHALQPATSDGGYDEIDQRLDEPLDEVRAAMNRLQPRYQQALSLRFLAGLSVEEAAQAMACSKPALSVTVHRAVAALRKAMEVTT